MIPICPHSTHFSTHWAGDPLFLKRNCHLQLKLAGGKKFKANESFLVVQYVVKLQNILAQEYM